MSNPPTTTLTPGQAVQLAVLLDALDGVVLSAGERASVTWLAGFETNTVENIASVITRARQTDPNPPRGAGFRAVGGRSEPRSTDKIGHYRV